LTFGGKNNDEKVAVKIVEMKKEQSKNDDYEIIMERE